MQVHLAKHLTKEKKIQLIRIQKKNDDILILYYLNIINLKKKNIYLFIICKENLIKRMQK